jgi:TPR repeat protein
MSNTYRKWLSVATISILALSQAMAGMSPEEVKAFESIKAKAEKGDALSQHTLGIFYLYGEGVEKAPSEAAKWFRKAAEQGLAKAQYDLGYCYEDGEGIEKDKVLAFNWYHKAAAQGNAKAQYSVGFACHYGEGTTKDFELAGKWYTLSANQDYAPAQYMLGRMYDVGFGGLAEDNALAASLFKKAAFQGYDLAQYELAISYSLGNGVIKDTIEAYAYWNIAGVTNLVARDQLQALENKMLHDEVVAGQKRTRELKKEIEASIEAKKAEAEKKAGK